MIPLAQPDRPVELPEMAEQVRDHADLAAFSRALLRDFKEKPEEWENRDLASFLEAMGAWIDDMNGFYQVKGGAIPLQPSWKTLAQILLAAKMYE